MFSQKPTTQSGDIPKTGKAAAKDSIRTKVFEERGMGVWGKGGRNFLQKVSPSLPPLRATLTATAP